jgi:uncharacterized protein YdhG (YjbR/CyaY superfamily)
MARSAAKTVQVYLAELPPDRRAVVAAVREIILRNLPEGYREAMAFGMIGYEIPLEVYPHTYNGQPLSYAALAAQKNYYTLYLMSAYAGSGAEESLREAFRRAGKKLDMGKSCIRFRTLDDLELDAIAKMVAATPPREFMAMVEASRKR